MEQTNKELDNKLLFILENVKKENPGYDCTIELFDGGIVNGVKLEYIVTLIEKPNNETTKIIQIEDEYFGIPITLDATECCKVNPITNENYCPNCGKKIIR